MTTDLHILAAAQHDVLTTGQALAAGHDRDSLLRLVRAGELLHLARGVYAVPSPHESRLTPEARHLRLARGLCLFYPDARLSGHSALVSLGLPCWGADLRRVHLERPVGREVFTQAAVIRPHWEPASEALRGIPAEDGATLVRPATAVVQHCLEAGVVPGVVGADAALHAGLVAREELESLALAVKGWPRSSRVRSMLAHADGRSESVGESRLRTGLAMVGLHAVPQVEVRDERGRFVARVDLMVAGRVVLEFDGLVKYRDGGAEALIAEKRREDELRRLGYVVIRVTWRELDHLGPIVARVRSAAASPENVVLHPRTLVG